MYAIISDIHSNIEALEAVFRDMERRGVEEVVCLGDVVGYGPDAESCIDLIKSRCRFCIRGNHDDAVMGDALDFNPIAREVIDGTRQLLRPGLFSSAAKRERWSFLKGLVPVRKEGRVLYVHGSPRDPVKEYVMRTDVVFAPEKLLDIFSRIEWICFVGHTHQPGVFLEKKEGGRMVYEHRSPSELGEESLLVLGDRKVLSNVGSVGQSRDQDSRACYVIVEEDGEGRPSGVRFVRVEYDYRPTMEKIEAIDWINNLCATRLEIGR
ncbi:MAG: metallophosphoesterase family protein [Planctomycetota bacterium]